MANDGRWDTKMLYGAPHPVALVAHLRTLKEINIMHSGLFFAYHIRWSRIGADVPGIQIQDLSLQPRTIAQAKLQSSHAQYPIG